MEIKYSKLHPEGKEPFRPNESDAGYDLFSTQYIVIEPFQRKLVSTGINVEIPQGFYGRIAPRSGLACKKGIDVMAGVIDSGYRGEVKVLLINLNFEGYNLQPNVFESMFGSANKIEIKCHTVKWKSMETLEESQRGEQGFGSSGQ